MPFAGVPPAFGLGPTMQPNATEFTWTKKRHRAAQLVADDTLTDVEIAADLRIHKTTLERWKQRPEFIVHVREIVDAYREKIMQRGIAIKAERVRQLQQIADKLTTVMAERAEALAGEAPGGGTGTITRQLKSVGVGENNMVVEEYVVDKGLLLELRGTLEQTAKELGEWVVKHEHAGDQEKPIRVVHEIAGVDPAEL